MDIVEYKKNVACVYTKSRSHWRGWLQQHYATVSSIWLIIYKKELDIPSVYYPQAVDEALCFG